jgi:uncharacterized repeat protein (TIGR03803 family)
MAIRRLLTALLWCSAYGAAQNPPPTLTTIYNFTNGSDGGYPTPLTMGEGGVLYGATSGGGAYGYGTVFSLTPPVSPSGSWTYTVLYNFQGATASGYPDFPVSSLTIGPGGVFYGATGNGTIDSGAIYSLTPPASPGGQWPFAIVASFDGYLPSGVAISPGGVLFGTDYGLTSAVFALVPPPSPGGSWTQQTITTYFGAFQSPTGGLTIGGGGVLYVSTVGDENVWADVQELAPPATPGGAWKQKGLYQFTGIYSGLATDVVIGSGGVLYGTVYAQLGGGGSIYSLTPPVSPGGAWTEATLFEFPTPRSGDGAIPGPLTLGENDKLYGTTQYGGVSGAGTAYVLLPPATPGGAWTQIPLHTFTGSDGMYPTRLVIGSGGVLYGTTGKGGAYGYGTVFAITE